MIVLGLTGGLDPVYENRLKFPAGLAHDAAAVILRDGVVVAGTEQERLDRIKHSNKFPWEAIDLCLAGAGVGLDGVDKIAVYVEEAVVDAFMLEQYVKGGTSELWRARDYVAHLLRGRYGRCDPSRIVFVDHHHAHAMSAYAMSGFDDTLVVTVDGTGPEGSCTTVWQGQGGRLEPLQRHRLPDSLGYFYDFTIAYLGYDLFDEYKVMGLAPYGDPARYRSVLQHLYRLTPDGWFKMAHEREAWLPVMFQGGLGKPRRRGEPFTQEHKDIAAALQEAFETILFHFFRHHKAKTGLDRVCYAGGSAQNVTFNGKLLDSGLFAEVFIQPASYDAGGAIGAAYVAHAQSVASFGPKALSHVYWGTDIGSNDDVLSTLERWRDFVGFERMADTVRRSAELLADGEVLGWVQGRSEFGARALGNRSIVADPRPAENKRRINAMVKKREAYRPFAPSVLEERAGEYYVLPKITSSPFMLYSMKTKPEAAALLGAVTHVDGSARVQTVSKETNPKYWELIRAFEERTGVPVLLNTSFNNDAEPIVDSVDESVICFLTTKLDRLVVGDYLIEKRDVPASAYAALTVTLPRNRTLHENTSFADGVWQTRYSVESTYVGHRSTPVSKPVYDALSLAARGAPGARLGDVLDELRIVKPEERQAAIDEVRELWSKRVVDLRPGGAAAKGAPEERR